MEVNGYYFPELRDLVVNEIGDTGYGKWKNFNKEENMKLKCLECGFKYELEKLGSEMCPKCGCIHWSMSLKDSEKLFNKSEEKIDRERLEMLKKLSEETYLLAKKWLEEKGYINFEKKGNPYIPKDYMIRAIIYDILKQINKDYRNLIEKHLLADLPINSDLDILYKAELERIENIKI